MNFRRIVIRIALITAILLGPVTPVVQAAPLRQDPPPPVADAGPPTLLGEAGLQVILDGSNSTGTGLTYQWTQTGGLAVTLTGADTVRATFIFPFLPGLAQPVFTFQLTVTDSLGRTATDTVTVTEARPPAPPPLSAVAVPEPPNLADYVRDKTVAIQLGKALFWDMQVGSDGITACASCHYAAGTDNRVTNQVHPGPNGVFDSVEPNGTLLPADFPFHQVVNLVVQRSVDDIVGTQGVQTADFGGLAPGQAVDPSIPVADPVFHVNGANTRQVTGRNAATAVNAVYNLRNFWDGRANFVFNGASPFGVRDPDARIWQVQPDNSLAQVSIQIEYASLASQAVGPANSSIEMAWRGRSFPLLGRKMLGLTPLDGQRISPTDSVLGPLVAANGMGLNTSYLQLIQTAFEPEYWDSTQIVVFDNAGVPAVAPDPGRPLTDSEFSLVEMNFSLFFGLAIQLYEATLTSGQTPFDLYQAGEFSALTPQQVRGLDVFVNVAGCTLCHLGPEFTSASVSALLAPPLPGFPEEVPVAIEQMAMASGNLSVYDLGFYNIGVRPTAEDLGIGGNDPFGNPLSFTRLTQLGIPIGPPVPQPPLINPADYPAVHGAFKTPTLRNVELTAPYMHNGGMSSLEQVVDFYARGADFPQQNIDDLAPAIVPLPLSAQDRADIIAFLKSLTDERVRYRQAPFDHPQLMLPNGAEWIEVAATGAAGGPPIEPFVEINPALTVEQVLGRAEIRLGETTPVTVTVANTGDVILRQVTLTSNLCTFTNPLDDQWSAAALDPGESWTFTCDAAPGSDVTHLVTAAGQHKLGDVISANSTAEIRVQRPSLSVSITPTPATLLAGETVLYAYVATNTGNVPLTNVTVTDDRLGPVPLNRTTLAPGQTATGSLSYVTQIADILATLANNVQASGQPPLGGAVTATSGTVVDVTGAAIFATIQPDPPAANAGEAVTLHYTVQNLGDVALQNVTLTDSVLGSISLTATTLAPGATAAGAGTRLLLPADLPGPVPVSAVAAGTPDTGSTVSFQAATTVALTGAASLAVGQYAPASGHVDSTIQYTFRITNTGPVAFTQLVARDSLLGDVSLATGNLAPGATTTAFVPFDIVESQLPGPLANTITVTGTTAAGLPVIATTGGNVALTSRPELTVVQRVDAPQASPGQNVTFTVEVQNTGDVSLRGISAVSDRLGPFTLNTTQLAPGEVASGQLVHTVVEGDLPGPYVATASASGTPRYGNGPAVTAQDTDSVPLTSYPAIEVAATPNPATIGVGFAVSYQYVIRNSGDVTLSNIVLRDDRTGVIQIPPTVLAPGATLAATSSYIVQESDLPGPLTNGVSVNGMTALNQLVSATNSTTVDLTAGPALQLTIKAQPSPAAIGDTLTLEYTVKNVGNVTLNNVTAQDTQLGPVTLAASTLAPGVSTKGTLARVVTEGDLPGPLQLSASAAGTTTTGATANTTSNLDVAISSQPALQLTVQASKQTANVGDTVAFTYTVTNSGDVSLTDVGVSDTRLGAVLAGTTLAPGEAATGTATYTVQETDLDGPLPVTASATAQPPANLPALSKSASLLLPLTSRPGLTIQWQPSADPATVGEPVVYHYTVLNTGNVSLENITLSDSRLGLVPLHGSSLAPGEAVTGTRTLLPTQGDLPGPLLTTATAGGSPVYGSGAAVNQVVATTLPLNTAAGLLTSITAPAAVDVGQQIAYTYHITNTSDVTLLNLTGHDSHVGPVTLANTFLAPGESTWGTAALPVTEDLLPGPLTTSLTVTATPPVGAPVTGWSSAHVALVSRPTLAVSQVPAVQQATVGDLVGFAVEVQNKGNVTLAGLSLTGDRFGPVTLSSTELAPGAKATGTASYRITEADLGGLTSTVSAAATAKHGGEPAQATGTVQVTVVEQPALQLVVTAPPSASAGQPIALYYALHNTGNVTLRDIVLVDDLAGEITLPATTLAPGGTLIGNRQLTIAEGSLPGPVHSRARAEATSPLGRAVTAAKQTPIQLTSQGQLSLSIGATLDAPVVGDQVQLTYAVQNVGNVTLENLMLTDDYFGPIPLAVTTLAPGERTSGTLAHAIRPKDIVGALIHTGSVQGSDRLGRTAQAAQSHTLNISGARLTLRLIEQNGEQVTSQVIVNGALYELSTDQDQRLDGLATGRYELAHILPAGVKGVEAQCDGGEWTSADPAALSVNLDRMQVLTCIFHVEVSATGVAGENTLHLPVLRN